MLSSKRFTFDLSIPEFESIFTFLSFVVINLYFVWYFFIISSRECDLSQFSLFITELEPMFAITSVSLSKPTTVLDIGRLLGSIEEPFKPFNSLY